MKVLVTGASGYIGSHTCKVLKEHGHHVTGWDLEIHDSHNDVSAYCNSYRHYDIAEFVRGEYDAVVHLAGRSVVPDSIKEPTEYYRVNAMGTANMLKRISTDHFLFASTSSAWEMASPYARSKVAAEDIIKEHSKNYTIFRFFNVSGTDGVNRQLGRPTHLIRVAAEVAANKREKLQIYGTDYPTRDGTCIRDYVHVLDVADAIANSVSLGAANTPYECLGSDTGFTVLEVVDAMRKVTGHAIPTEVVGRREGDAVSSVVTELSKLIKLKRDIYDMCSSQYKLELTKNA